jgi:hypothetical protein
MVRCKKEEIYKYLLISEKPVSSYRKLLVEALLILRGHTYVKIEQINEGEREYELITKRKLSVREFQEVATFFSDIFPIKKMTVEIYSPSLMDKIFGKFREI